MILNKLLKPANIALSKAQFTRKFGTSELEELMKIIHDANWFKREVETLRNKVQLQSDTIHSNQVQLLNTALNDIFPSSNTPLDKVISEGTAIEPNFHLLYHPSHLPETELGKDGYDPDFAPPNPYIDRVWAKGKLEFNPQNLIKVGQKVDLKTKTHQITQSSSSTKGPIFSVELLKEYTNSLGNCLNEYRTLSYFLNANEVARYGVKFDQNAKIIKTRERSYDRMVEVNPNSLLLFRYSALTFNAHKIHYDFNYVTKEEGYRGKYTI
jgi:3-methylfumaryl-CoA hydratase